MPGNACAAILVSSRITEQPYPRVSARAANSDAIGGWFFAADPDRSFVEQTVFWAPEALPTVIPVRPATLASSHSHISLDLTALGDGQLRQGTDGWHAVLHLHGVEHRIWLKEAPVISVPYAVELPLDRDFEFRADAGRRLWKGLNGRPQGKPLHALSPNRRRRLARTLRALDARVDGASYREIAEVLFPAIPISGLDWKTSDLRKRIIRLAQTGFALMHGGYRALLRPPKWKK